MLCISINSTVLSPSFLYHFFLHACLFSVITCLSALTSLIQMCHFRVVSSCNTTHFRFLSAHSSQHSSPTQASLYFHFQHQLAGQSPESLFFSTAHPPQLLTLSSSAAPHSLPTSISLSWPGNTKLHQPFP